MTRVVFWICAFLVVYPYVFYPLVLFFTYSLTQVWRDLLYLAGRRDRRTPTPAPNELPAVSIIVPAPTRMPPGSAASTATPCARRNILMITATIQYIAQPVA